VKRLTLVALFFFFLSSCFKEVSTKPVIVCSLPVWKGLVKYLSDGDFEVVSLLKKGSSPHGFELKPSQRRFLEEAKLVILNGLGIDDWALKGVPKEKILNLGEILKTSHREISANYHLWMNPEFVKEILFIIADKLSKLNPSRRTYYLKRASDYAQAIDQFVKKGRKCGEKKNVWVIVYHPVWTPLLDSVGIKSIYVVENPEVEVSASKLQSVIEKGKTLGVKLVIGETFSGEKTVKLISEELKVPFILLNPIPEEDYLTAFSLWIRKICKALGKE
jgi:zinc transport system substrate-binding protein